MIVKIVCNNVILKYVEDELVLSTNVRHASVVSVDGCWEPAFAELTATDLVMRKLISVSDLTVCLDKRGAMGKIESYEVGPTKNIERMRIFSALFDLNL